MAGIFGLYKRLPVVSVTSTVELLALSLCHFHKIMMIELPVLDSLLSCGIELTFYRSGSRNSLHQGRDKGIVVCTCAYVAFPSYLDKRL